MSGKSTAKDDRLETKITEGAPAVEVWEYFWIIRRKWHLILLTALVSMGLTAFITLRLPKIYRATTTVRIETQAPQVLGRNVENVVEMGTGTFWSNVEYYETQYRIIESRDIASRVVKEFKLNEDPIFMRVPLGERPRFKPVSIDRAIDEFQKILTVQPIKDSRLVKIHVDSREPERARLLSNAVAKAYVERNLETMLQSTVDAADWLSKQVDEARAKLTDSEQKLYDFKRENDILSFSLEDRQNIIAAQIAAAAAKLGEARVNRIELQARKTAITNVARSADPMAIPLEALNSNPLIQNLKENYSRLSQEYGELSERYGEKFPQIVELKAKLKRTKEEIAREVKNVVLAVDAELAAAKSTESGITQSLDDLRKQALDLNQKEVDFNRFAREKDNNEKMYELLLGRTKEADLSRLLRVNNVEILDPAVLPDRPIRPRLKVNLVVALIAGLVLGIVLAVVVEFADRSIKTHEDIEALGVVLLGIVPSIDTLSDISGSYSYGRYSRRKREKRREKRKALGRSGKEEPRYDLFVHDNPKSQVAESCRAIRTNLLFMFASRPSKRILVTSPSPEEGKTTVALSLAIAMAQSGSRMLLVDTDMRRPKIHRVFGRNSERGASTVVMGETSLDDAIVKTDIPNLDILPCGPTPPNPAELMHTESFARMVDEVSARYDRIIFDSPPIGVVTDPAILSKMVDGTVLVLKSMRTTRDSARHAVGVLKDIEANVLGAVLNDLDLHDRKYGRNYYYYYSKYGYYYSDSKGEAASPVSE